MAQARLKWSIEGTRLFTESPRIKRHGKRQPCPVIIPHGRCVYWWAGCALPRYGLSETLCRVHFYEVKGWSPGKGKRCPMKGCDRLANMLGGPCTRCYTREYDRVHPDDRLRRERKYRADNEQKIKRRKVKWRLDNHEHVKEYRREYARKERARKRAEREAQDEG